MQVDTQLFRALARLQLASPGAARGRQQGERRSKAVGSGVEFADHRPYNPGDDQTQASDWAQGNRRRESHLPVPKPKVDRQEYLSFTGKTS